MNLLKTAATISGLTLLSRITGLARETLTAAYFGAGSQTDAFFVAFRLPNLLRRLFAEGAFSQAFVPVLGQIKAQEGEAAALRLARNAALVMAADADPLDVSLHPDDLSRSACLGATEYLV